MTDPLDDLMYRAGLTAQGCWDEMDEYDRAAVLKFAELIVKECLKQIYGRTKIAPGDYNWPDKDVGYNKGIDDAYKQIKKHFGVE